MDKEFITIGEAAQLLRQADSVIMRLIKEALQAGVAKEDIMKAEMRDGRMMYLVSRTFLAEESSKEREAPREEEIRPQKTAEAPVQREDTISLLERIIDKKDEQIADLSGKIDQLIERDHETNVLLKGLQDRLFLLEQGEMGQPEKGKSKRTR